MATFSCSDESNASISLPRTQVRPDKPAILPTLFVPHGAPQWALTRVEDDPAALALRSIAQRLPEPRAIIVVSAHWDTPRPQIGGALRPDTVHDFGGFDPALYQIRYPAPGQPALAREIADLFQHAGLISPHENPIAPEAGLDHAVWIPLRFMYPEAHIPVVPLSIQSQSGTDHAIQIGRALRSLPPSGVLLMASGNLTHSLKDYFFTGNETEVRAYVHEFKEWIYDQILCIQGTYNGKTDNRLMNFLHYRERAPLARRAHPGDDHFLPLLVALAAAGPMQVERLCTDVYDRSLAMDSFAFWPQA